MVKRGLFLKSHPQKMRLPAGIKDMRTSGEDSHLPGLEVSETCFENSKFFHLE